MAWAVQRGARAVTSHARRAGLSMRWVGVPRATPSDAVQKRQRRERCRSLEESNRAVHLNSKTIDLEAEDVTRTTSCKDSLFHLPAAGKILIRINTRCNLFLAHPLLELLFPILARFVR